MEIKVSSPLATKILKEIGASIFTKDKRWNIVSDDFKHYFVEKEIGLAGDLGFVRIDLIDSIELDDLEKLKAMATECNDRGALNYLSGLINLMSSADTSKPLKSSRAFIPIFNKILSKNYIKGWIFKDEGDGLSSPYLITSSRYYKGDSKKGEQSYVMVGMTANAARTSKKQTSSYKDEQAFGIYISDKDCYGKSVFQILMDKGFLFENPVLHDRYNKDVDIFIQHKDQVNKVFEITDGYSFSADPESRNYHQKETVSGRRLLINDETLISRDVIGRIGVGYALPKHLRKSIKTEEFNFIDVLDITDDGDSKILTEEIGNSFTEVPYHTRLYMFDLNTHLHGWFHVSNIKPHVFNTNISEKLVLPKAHKDLIDILSHDQTIMLGDIVDGKSGGTTIMCKGKPGLGKTLTAEVYSEVVEKPLYRIHSGQLGTSAGNIEENLKVIFKNAIRWNAILLIDECDVFVRERGNDIGHNAVVAAFLKSIEYYSGLLFMTTNRADDIDDAILSRCVAVIKYETPDEESGKKIWRVLSDQFNFKISDELIVDLQKTFPQASGRDIKELLKLTIRYCHAKKIDPSLDDFKSCAIFKGLI